MSIYRRISLVALLTHLPLLFNDGIYWDSWMPEYAAARGDLYLTVQPFHDTGVPLVGYLYYAIGQLPSSVFIYKLLAFASITVIAMAAFAIAQRSRYLSEIESQVVAVAPIVWAAFRVHAVDCVMPYSLATACLLVMFAVCMRRPLTPLLRAISLVTATFSLLLYSPLLVFHYALLALWFVIDRRERPAGWRWFASRADFVLLPVVVFVAAGALFPPTAAMADNYSIKLDLGLYATHAKNFLYHGVYLMVRENVSVLAVAVMVVFAGAVAVVIRRPGRTRVLTAIAEAPVHSWRTIGWLAATALALFVAGALPFVLVGKSPDSTFWWSRQAILIPFSIGVAFVAATWALRRFRNRFVMWGWLVIVAWIASGNWVRHQQTYLMLQARWVSYRSLVHNIKQSHAFDDLTFVHLDEQPFLEAGFVDHTSYTWSVMFSHFGWGAEDKAVIARLPYEYYCEELRHQPLESRRFALTNVDLAGKHGRMIIHNGPDAPYGSGRDMVIQLRVVANYFLHRFITGDMAMFLSRVTSVERAPVESPVVCAAPR